MPSFSIPEGRRFKRILTKQRASMVVNLDRNRKKLPCLVLDSSKDGFRLRGTFHLRRGQTIEVVLDANPRYAVRCDIVWVGKPGSKEEGEVGVQTV